MNQLIHLATFDDDDESEYWCCYVYEDHLACLCGSSSINYHSIYNNITDAWLVEYDKEIYKPLEVIAPLVLFINDGYLNE